MDSLTVFGIDIRGGEMMMTATLDYAIDVAMELSVEQQEMLVEIIRRRHVDARRREMADDAQISLAVFRSGALEPQPAAVIIRELHQELDE